jgi:hypothetical protein
MIDRNSDKKLDSGSTEQRLIEQLHRVQEDLETYYIAKVELEEALALRISKLDAKKQELQELSQELALKERCINDLRQSWSWRLTSPLRSVGSLFSALSGK